MSYFIPIGGWVNFSGGGVVEIPGGSEKKTVSRF